MISNSLVLSDLFTLPDLKTFLTTSPYLKYLIYYIFGYVAIVGLWEVAKMLKKVKSIFQSLRALFWVAFTCGFITFSISYFCGTFTIFNNEIGISGFHDTLTKFGEDTQAILSTYRFSSSYGLFRTMTGVDGRYELVIYGSQDLESWKVYEFSHKPTKTHKMPTFVAPHQPRLDWQMWFSALNPGVSTRDTYITKLVYQLFLNSESVNSLLSKNPFPDDPPQYIKINRIIYEFTNFGNLTMKLTLDDIKADLNDFLTQMITQTVEQYLPELGIKSKDGPKWWKTRGKRKGIFCEILYAYDIGYFKTTQRSEYNLAMGQTSTYPLHDLQDIDLRILLIPFFLIVLMNLLKPKIKNKK